jgi:hypothetical protein
LAIDIEVAAESLNGMDHSGNIEEIGFIVVTIKLEISIRKVERLSGKIEMAKIERLGMRPLKQGQLGGRKSFQSRTS